MGRFGLPERRISIHAPLTWRDWITDGACSCGMYFNPRATYVARLCQPGTSVYTGRFQSTRHLRGATAPCVPHERVIKFQSTRHLRGATSSPRAKGSILEFQSTRHLRGATLAGMARGLFGGISIHAPLTWRDTASSHLRLSLHYFNPRATYVARRLRTVSSQTQRRFQSTRHLRGATRGDRASGHAVLISIHAPLTWRDVFPWRRAPHPGISIHAPLTWRDFVVLFCLFSHDLFQSTRHLRGAT